MSGLLKSIFLREICTKNRYGTLKADLGVVLEDFESLATDKYVTVTDDDGTMVPPLACEFCKGELKMTIISDITHLFHVFEEKSYILCVVDEKGDAMLYDTRKTGQYALLKVWQTHTNAVFDTDWIPGEDKILTASGDQTVALWDVSTGQRINVFRGHTSSVRTVNVQRDHSAVFATGSRDGHIMVWDTRCTKKDGYIQPVNTIRNVHTLPQSGVKAKRKYKLPPARDSQMSVIDVKFQTDMHLWSAGAVDGCVKLWDLRKNYSLTKGDSLPKHTLTYCGVNRREHGYSSLAFDSSHSQLFASCTDDIIYQFDAAGLNYKPANCYKGHKNSTFYIKASVSPDDQFLITGSTDEMAYIYQIGKSNLSPVVLKGHTQEVSAVRWSPVEMNKIVTLSDDCMMRIWRIHRRQSPAGPEEVTGTAERTHREIGITAEERPVETENIDPNIPQASSKLHTTISAKSPKPVSPSIKSWLKKNITPGAAADAAGTSSLSLKKNAKISIFGNEKLPCKRKLVDDEDESDKVEVNPAKRRHINNSPIKSYSSSPKKFESPRKAQSPRKLEIKCSPHKAMLSPELQGRVLRNIGPSLASRLNSPEKLDSDCKDINTLRKLSSFVPQSPTVNLPNLVLEGSVNKVNLHNRTEEKENCAIKQGKKDWLTKLRLEKYGLNVDESSTENVSPKLSVSESTSPKLSKSSLSSGDSPWSHKLSQSSQSSQDPVSNSGDNKAKLSKVGGRISAFINSIDLFQDVIYSDH
ncbi:hypothetical protein FSP39_005770 [Pinctada imbricata]|uniref:Denticleless protein homolog n=1 Tax=Pinctada imbricata TaxID=66713 RepID=A0AA88XVL8_PINIB|nr:hypothetical protein FSP39_005770 [Pinctada imbricata]